MSQDATGVFKRNIIPGGGAPAALRDVGMHVVGEVVAIVVDKVKDWATKEIKLDKRGNEQPQINICLQTDQRNWAGVEIAVQGPRAGQVLVPLYPEGHQYAGHPMQASEDTGLRWVYAKYRMIDAIGEALDKVGVNGGTLPIGSVLGVRHSGSIDLGKGNPLGDYEARVKLPAPTQAPGAFPPPSAATPPPPPPPPPPVQQAPPPVAASDPWASPPAQPAAANPWPDTGW